MHLFAYDLHPMPAIHEYNQEILLWQPNEEEWSPESCSSNTSIKIKTRNHIKGK